MKYVIRKSTFETNSSSAHAFTFRYKNDEKYPLCEKKLAKVTDNFQKLLILIMANEKNTEFEIKSFEYFLNETAEKNNYTLSEDQASEYAKELFSKETDAEIVDYLKCIPFITKEDLELDDMLNYFEDFDDEYELFIFLRDWDKIIKDAKTAKQRFIKVYCELFNYPIHEVKNKVEEITKNCVECISEKLFHEACWEYCNCEVENLMKMIDYDKIPDIEMLAKEVFTDKISIFYCEAFYQSYCSIENILKDKRP